ncbi:MAG: hypothetical protein AAF851_06300 [Myxococcota bacterium]
MFCWGGPGSDCGEDSLSRFDEATALGDGVDPIELRGDVAIEVLEELQELRGMCPAGTELLGTKTFTCKVAWRDSEASLKVKEAIEAIFRQQLGDHVTVQIVYENKRGAHSVGGRLGVGDETFYAEGRYLREITKKTDLIKATFRFKQNDCFVTLSTSARFQEPDDELKVDVTTGCSF